MSAHPPLADLLPSAADFMIEVLDASQRAPQGALTWVDLNRIAARRLRPEASPVGADTSRLGHAVVVEMSAHGLLEVEMTTAADGGLMVRRASHPRSAMVWTERTATA